MSPSIGVYLRVTGHCTQGDRKYMEDVFSVTYQQTTDEKDLEYAFFGIFDGHGGREAAAFAREHLMNFIVKQNNFWADDDDRVLRAIRDGFIQTHQAMWGELEKWPKTLYGRPCTAGTTASIAFIRRGKIYIGHVGDSAIILEPDTYVYPIDVSKNRCLILGTDGVWNMLTPAEAVTSVCQTQRYNEKYMLYKENTNTINVANQTAAGCQWINSSKHLVERSIERWNSGNLLADNVSVVTVMLEPIGSSRTQMMGKRQRKLSLLNAIRGGENKIEKSQVTPAVAPVASASMYDYPMYVVSNDEKDVDMDYVGFNKRGNVVVVTNSIISLPPLINVETCHEDEDLKRITYDQNRRKLSVEMPSYVPAAKTTPKPIQSTENFKTLCKETLLELCMNPCLVAAPYQVVDDISKGV